MTKVLLVRGDPELYSSVEEALRHVQPGENVYLVVCDAGKLYFLRVQELAADKKAEKSSVAVVFDQMFRGFAEIISREIPEIDAYEVLGRGIEKPIRKGNITLLPAHDDFDVMKNVENLAKTHKKVVLVTGDKKLARQVEALGRNVFVIYLPPGEAAGKELLINTILNKLKNIINTRLDISV